MKANSAWSTIAVLLLWFIGMDLALQYGSIWESQANPTPGVTVVMNDGEEIAGELQRTWSNEWLLTKDDGTRFVVTSYKYMRFELHEKSGGLSSRWRSWLPVIHVNLLPIAYLLGTSFRRRRRP